MDILKFYITFTDHLNLERRVVQNERIKVQEKEAPDYHELAAFEAKIEQIDKIHRMFLDDVNKTLIQQ